MSCSEPESKLYYEEDKEADEMHHVQLFTVCRFDYLNYYRIIYYKLELLDFIITLGNYFIPFPLYQGIPFISGNSLYIREFIILSHYFREFVITLREFIVLY